MAIPGNGDHQLKRIVLPSGKTIEVVYFNQPASAGASPEPQQESPAAPETDVPQDGARSVPQPPTAPAERDLHVCPACESELVYPVQWEEADESHWRVTLRCPNCEHAETGVYEQDQCDRFDDELERGTDALTRDYKRLVTANLAEEIDRFAHALKVDGILPMDF